jgi:hypothetical protein
MPRVSTAPKETAASSSKHRKAGDRVGRRQSLVRFNLEGRCPDALAPNLRRHRKKD